MNDTLKELYRVVLSEYNIMNVATRTSGMWSEHIMLYAWKNSPKGSSYGFFTYRFYLHEDSSKNNWTVNTGADYDD